MLILLIPAVIYCAGLSGNIIYICFALVGLQLILFFCHYNYFIKRLIGPCLFEYLKILGTPIFAAVLMSIIVLISSYYITGPLLIQIGIGIISYMTISWFWQHELFIEFNAIFPFHFKQWNILNPKIKKK
jgi:hypothetical protein